MINKRGFLLGAASAVAAPQVLAAAASPLAAGELAADGLPMLHNDPGLAAWRPYLGQAFALTDGRQTWQVTLNQADARVPGELPARTEQFVLGFTRPGQGQGQIPAGVHALRHANGQGLLIHLADDGPQAMRAEFNLLLRLA